MTFEKLSFIVLLPRNAIGFSGHLRSRDGGKVVEN